MVSPHTPTMEVGDMNENYLSGTDEELKPIVADLLRIQYEALRRVDEPIVVTSHSIRRARAMFVGMRSLLRTIQIDKGDDLREWEATAAKISRGEVSTESLLEHAGKDVRAAYRMAMMEAGEQVNFYESSDEQALFGVLVTLVHLYPAIMTIEMIQSRYDWLIARLPHSAG